MPGSDTSESDSESDSEDGEPDLKITYYLQRSNRKILQLICPYGILSTRITFAGEWQKEGGVTAIKAWQSLPEGILRDCFVTSLLAMTFGCVIASPAKPGAAIS
jgi:hypothetical protein